MNGLPEPARASASIISSQMRSKYRAASPTVCVPSRQPRAASVSQSGPKMAANSCCSRRCCSRSPRSLYSGRRPTTAALETITWWQRLWTVLMRTRERFPGDAAGQGIPGEPLLQLPGGVPAEAAERHFLRRGLPGEQQVYGPEGHAAGLARPGAGDHQQRAGAVADDLSLLGVQLRVQAQDYWCDVHGSPRESFVSKCGAHVPYAMILATADRTGLIPAGLRRL